MLQGATATGNNTASIVITNVIVTIINGNECPGKNNIVSVLNNEELPLLQLTAPGKMRLRKLKTVLEKGGDIIKSCLQYNIISTLADHEHKINDSLGDAKEGESLLQWVHSQSATVKSSPSFARALLAECVYSACQKVDDGEDLTTTLPTVAQALTVAVSNVLSSTTDQDQINKGIYILNGVQIACVSDDMFNTSDLAPKIFTYLHKPMNDTGFGIIPINIFKQWLNCTNTLSTTASSTTTSSSVTTTTSVYGIRESEGRTMVEKEVRNFITSL